MISTSHESEETDCSKINTMILHFNNKKYCSETKLIVLMF